MTGGRSAESGIQVLAICRKLKATETTIYRRKWQYGEMG